MLYIIFLSAQLQQKVKESNQHQILTFEQRIDVEYSDTS